MHLRTVGTWQILSQALNKNLDDSARCFLTALWPAGAPRKSEERELKACYSSTAREFNCESMNLNLWRSLWAVHVSVYPPVSTVHLLFLMWFLNHSGKLLMKLIGCLSCRSLLLLFIGYLHPYSTPSTACSHPDDTRKTTELQRWRGKATSLIGFKGNNKINLNRWRWGKLSKDAGYFMRAMSKWQRERDNELMRELEMLTHFEGSMQRL